MSLFKAYRLSINVLFLGLDLLRRSSRNLSTLQEESLAVQLLGPLCLSIASKYEQRSTFSIHDMIKASPNLLPCRHITDEYHSSRDKLNLLKSAEFSVLRLVSFTIRSDSIQPHESLFTLLQQPFDIFTTKDSKARVSDTSLFLLFQAYLDDRVAFTDNNVLVAACLMAALKGTGQI